MAFSSLHEHEAARKAAQEQETPQPIGFYYKQVILGALRSPGGSLSDLEKQFLGRIADYLEQQVGADEVGPVMTANAAYQVLLSYNGQAEGLAKDLRGILSTTLNDSYAAEVGTEVGARSKIQKAPWYSKPKQPQ